ncbi:hypothetical protein [Legionella feeleii]|uniref:Dot/Icm secretion system substrate n=1 Tax=Legionella feeleii TaxID=453 RepID=A0A0W0U8V8_9GAMM|nr:hypothetical protein [Legionella feeleii]KTD04336.1 substrate of the Dot/Icm secretion system [Legionella feeleii]SPX62869.1 Dot/Icm secretion system substrate [Legionella feeleii]
MGFVLPVAKFLSKLDSLDRDYEIRSGKDLEKSPQPYAISCFFGAKDIATRRQQIGFIKGLLAALRKNWESLTTPEEVIQSFLTALHILMTACFYIKSKTNSNYLTTPILSQLLDEAAEISPINLVDEKTRANCLLATKGYLETNGPLKAVNTKTNSPFTELEWHDFLEFTKDQCALLDKKQVKNYPITSLLRPLIAQPLQILGWSVGYVMGDTISHIPPVRYALTAVLGGGVYLTVGSSASVCMIVLVPAVASRILDTFCGLSLAFVMGKSLRIVGEGVGFGIGIPLDIGCQLIGEAVSGITTLYHHSKSGEKLSGISLVDGHLIQDGIDLVLVNLSHIPAQLTLEHKEHLTQCKTGEFEIGETEVIVTIDGQHTRLPLLTECETDVPVTSTQRIESTTLELK